MGNGECRSSMDPTAQPDGCVHRLIVRPSPGTDLSEKVTPTGHVALFWVSTAGQETRRDDVIIQVDRRAYGKDPFDATSTDADRPPRHGDPARAHRPRHGLPRGEYRPLRVQAADPMAAPTETRSFDRLTPAADNRYDVTSSFPPTR